MIRKLFRAAWVAFCTRRAAKHLKAYGDWWRRAHNANKGENA